MTAPVIEFPSLHPTMPFADYIKDPVPGRSLSSSGSRLLIPPSCPAKFDYDRRHPSMPKAEFDLGTAAHHVLLGCGPELVVIDEANYQRKATQTKRDGAYAAGQTPVLAHQMDQVEDMVQKVREHKLAGHLLAEGTGEPEQSLFWIDPVTGVKCRARLDWLSRLRTNDGRLIIIDYKTARSADPDKFLKAIQDYRYHMQAAWYIDAVLGCGIADDAVFFFVVQEVTPPYLITIVELHEISGLYAGRELNEHARKVYRKCNQIGMWPGYAGARKLFLKGPNITYDDDVVTADLPDWEMRKMETIIGEGRR